MKSFQHITRCKIIKGNSAYFSTAAEFSNFLNKKI